MDTPSPLATIQDVYARFGRGDIPGILARLRPDVVWEPDALDHGIPWIRPGRGLDHVASFFAAVADLELHQFAPEAFAAGDRHVAVYVRHDVTYRPTGKRFAGVELHWWTVDDEGRVAAMRHFVDTVQQRAAATPG